MNLSKENLPPTNLKFNTTNFNFWSYNSLNPFCLYAILGL